MTTTIIMITIMARPSPSSSRQGLKHYHDEDMQSVSLKTDKPLNPDKFFPWVQDLVAKDGPTFCAARASCVQGRPRAFRLPGRAHDPRRRSPAAWRADEKRDSRIVFIGRNLPEDKIRQGFESCVLMHEPS